MMQKVLQQNSVTVKIIVQNLNLLREIDAGTLGQMDGAPGPRMIQAGHNRPQARKKKEHPDAQQETLLLLSPIVSDQCRSGDVLSRERDWMGRSWRCLDSSSIHSHTNVHGSSYTRSIWPGLAGRPVSRMSLGSWPTEIPALRHTLIPFGVRLYF